MGSTKRPSAAVAHIQREDGKLLVVWVGDSDANTWDDERPSCTCPQFGNGVVSGIVESARAGWPIA